MKNFDSAPETDDYLMLSGVQHFAFCPRQWGLIHIEQQWEENVRTFGGQAMHERADDPYFTESRGDLVISRSLPLVSHTLRLYGIADVVEFRRKKDGIRLAGREGAWLPAPVEYKYGQKKADDCDEVQLCAQAICLEEMFQVQIERGYLYYGKTRHRVEVMLGNDLRKRVSDLVESMWDALLCGTTPPAKLEKRCRNCSLYNLCLPELASEVHSASEYLERAVEDETV